MLGEPYTSETIVLPPDDEGPVVATLVRLPATGTPARGAVLHVHGFADYFFHTEYAEWWAARGYDFYALDLRKYGRSLLAHQTPNFVTDLREYFAELDLAWWRVTERDEHDSVVLSGHSTGGLTVALWANERRPSSLTATVLNSPWFDLKGPAWLRGSAARVTLARVGSRAPKRVIPRTVSGFYGRSLHHQLEGEWDYDLTWKPVDSRPIRVGWLSAIRRGHAELHAGLDLDGPILVLSSSRSHEPTEMSEEVYSTDIVLDVEHIRRWASSVGAHVTSIAIDGAMHDVVLSRPAVRAEAYERIDGWLRAWVETEATTESTPPDASREQHDEGDGAHHHDHRP